MTLTSAGLITGLIWVAAGGALGGMGRLALSNLMASRFGTHFPWGTLAVNLSGALVAGAVARSLSLSDEAYLVSTSWLLLVVGVLGGYTTVSSLSLQTLTLWLSEQHRLAALNLLGTCVAGLVLAGLGWWLAGLWL
ncbi:CrcB family protein [uncultured Marinobacter sp.]|uniref:CrcB family protein n=1 Tax=uncultured Marinobacter sp. TaxID=187379 RepID=UPI0030DC4368